MLCHRDGDGTLQKQVFSNLYAVCLNLRQQGEETWDETVCGAVNKVTRQYNKIRARQKTKQGTSVDQQYGYGCVFKLALNPFSSLLWKVFGSDPQVN